MTRILPLLAFILAAGAFKGVPFFHRSCVPIDQADLSTPEERGQMSFLDECAGVCGV